MGKRSSKQAGSKKKGLPAYGKTFRALHRNARISPFKCRAVVDLVRGKQIDEAIDIMEWEARRASVMIQKVLKSALANASNDLDVNLKALIVVDARIDGAGLLNGRRRWQPRAMGRAFPILKRTSHISITLAEPVEASDSVGVVSSAAAAAVEE